MSTKTVDSAMDDFLLEVFTKTITMIHILMAMARATVKTLEMIF